MTHDETDNRQLRSFGLMVGGIFSVIGLWPVVFHGAHPRWWALACGGLLVLPAVVWPEILRPIHKAWMKLGHAMGWLNTRIILGLIFFGVVTPIGIVRRWLGKDPMGKKLKRDTASYRVVRAPRAPAHLKRQY